ncbi:MAG: hypothetical protein RBR38_15245 [Desulfomicrobium apsheronum]|nr:hypothetical protein [Desulfomicrobium apsheronum]
MHQTTTDQPSWPVTLYPVGRFLFPVPKGLDFLGRSIKINDMFIEEIDWGEGDHSQQFRDLWMPVHDKAKEHYDRYVEWPVTRGGFAYKDVSDLFGHPSVMLCYAGSGDHKIDTFIALPDFILRIKQECAYDIGKECMDMEGATLNFFKHYHTDKHNLPSDIFWSNKGWVQGLDTWYESVRGSARRSKTETAPEISLRLNASMLFQPDVPPPTISSIRKVFEGNGIDVKILRSRQRSFEGMSGLEEVFIGTMNEDGKTKSELAAKWTIQGEPKKHDKQSITLRMDCSASVQDEALRMWDAVLNNFTSIQGWHAKKAGGR